MKPLAGILTLTLFLLLKDVSADSGTCNMKVPSDREVIQVISLLKDLETCPTINITITGCEGGEIDFPIDGDTSIITSAIAGGKPIVVVVLGFAVGKDKHVVKCLLEELEKQGNIVITIAVDYDNIINLLQGLTIIAQNLVPIIELLPPDLTTIVAGGAGAHLGAAVIGGLPEGVKFKKIIALDPVLPLLETDLFLKLLVGRSDEILVLHTSAGSYKPSIEFPPLVLPGATVLYVAPGDLTPFCGVGPSQFICRKALSFKFLLDILAGRILAANCENLEVLDYFAPKKCQGCDPVVLTIDTKLEPNAIYYLVIGALAHENAITGLLNDVLELVGTLLDDLLGKPIPQEHAILAIVRDVVVTKFDNVLAAGIIPLELTPEIEIVATVEVTGKIVKGGLLGELLDQVGDLLNNLLGNLADVVSDLGEVVGNLLEGLGLGSLGGPLDDLLNGVAVVVDYLGCQLDSLVSGLGDLLPGIGEPVEDLLGGVTDLLGGDEGVGGLVGGLLGGDEGLVGGLVGGLLGGDEGGPPEGELPPAPETPEGGGEGGKDCDPCEDE